MRHPLVNPSLAPFGFVNKISRSRLDYRQQLGGINCEKMLARLWAAANRLDAPAPRPVEEIIHRIMPGVAEGNRRFKGDFIFDGLPYLSRDIRILSAFVQWLGTNVGSCFLETDISKTWRPEVWQWDRCIFKSRYHYYHHEREFLIKFEKECSLEWRLDPVIFLSHECNPLCGKERDITWPNAPVCRFDLKSVTPRDRAVVDGLMRWLGQPAGRRFIAAYYARRARAREQGRKRFRENVLPLRSSTAR